MESEPSGAHDAARSLSRLFFFSDPGKKGANSEAAAVAAAPAPSSKDVVCSAPGVVVTTLQVAWHGLGEEKALRNLPVLSCDIRGSRLVTGGGDNAGRLWSLSTKAGQVGCTFLATLSGHDKSVNVVRFSPNGSRIASGGDDGLLLVWCRDAEKTAAANVEDGESEVWRVEHRISLATDVYDLAWNPAGTEIAAASTDHKCCIFALREQGFLKLAELANHRKYVQGVAFDPRSEYLASASNDKSVRCYSLFGKNRSRRKVPTCEFVAKKVMQEGVKGGYFHDDTVPTFFRRIAYSPEGSLLVCPTGRAIGAPEGVTNATHVFTRASLPFPVLQLPCGQYPSVAVRFSPRLYSLRAQAEPAVFDLPYRMLYAVGTTDSQVLIYDTQQLDPVTRISGIHYEPINDLAWSEDGLALIVASTDGFCSVITFDAEALGATLSPEEEATHFKINEPPPPLPPGAGKKKKEKSSAASTPAATVAAAVAEPAEPVPNPSKRDIVTAFFGAVVPKAAEEFVEMEVPLAPASAPTVFKKSKKESV
jgi:chromatin assembly factor 1 subunit B